MTDEQVIEAYYQVASYVCKFVHRNDYSVSVIVEPGGGIKFCSYRAFPNPAVRLTNWNRPDDCQRSVQRYELCEPDKRAAQYAPLVRVYRNICAMIDAQPAPETEA